MIEDVTDLVVYNDSLTLLEKIYLLSYQLPQARKRLRDQITGSAEAIAPQIAEGFGKKKSAKEFCRFLSMALGSSDETITHVREIEVFSKIYPRIDIAECRQLIMDYKILSKKLNRLITSWQKYT